MTMSKDPERDYHAARAQAELAWSHRATHQAAAEAHMKLSALHMERAMTARSSDD